MQMQRELCNHIKDVMATLYLLQTFVISVNAFLEMHVNDHMI